MIYLIQNEETLNIKIGYTAGCPHERRRYLQECNPGRLVLLGMLEGGLEQTAELHRAFERWHVARGWFRPAPSILALLCESPLVEELQQ